MVLLPLMTGPCGPIHNVFTMTGVSTSDRIVKTQKILVTVPEYTEVLSGTDEITALGTGNVRGKNCALITTC